MEQKNRSEWWFLTNINFITAGILYLIFMFILLIGNIVDVDIAPNVAGIILGVLIIIANFLGTKLAFREGKMGKREFILFNVYNAILYVVLALTFIPLATKFAGITEVNNILVSIITGIIFFVINFLFVFNFNAPKEVGDK